TRWHDRLYVAHGSGVSWRDPVDGRFHGVPGISGANRPVVIDDRLLVSTAAGVKEIADGGPPRLWTHNNAIALLASRRQPGWLFSGDSDGLWLIAPASGSAAGGRGWEM